jgi:hypothetical protein
MKPRIPNEIAPPKSRSYQKVDLMLRDGRIVTDAFINPDNEVCGRLVAYPVEIDEDCIDFTGNEIIGVLPKSGLLAQLGLRRWRRIGAP